MNLANDTSWTVVMTGTMLRSASTLLMYIFTNGWQD